jgi:hypothetical protein
VKFLADQDVWAHTLRAVPDWGHDVVSASDIGQARAPDVEPSAQESGPDLRKEVRSGIDRQPSDIDEKDVV